MQIQLFVAAGFIIFARVQADGAENYAGISEEETPFKQNEGFSPLFPEFNYNDQARLRTPGSYPWTRERKPNRPFGANQGLQLDELQWMQDQILQKLKQQYKLETERNLQTKNAYNPTLDDSRLNVNDEDSGEFGFSREEMIRNKIGDNFRERIEQQIPLGYIVPKGFYDDEPVEGSQEEEHGIDAVQNDLTPGGSGIFKNVPFVKDPSTFAYLPSDHRFYVPDITTQKFSTIQENLDDDSLRVNDELLNNVDTIKVPAYFDTRQKNEAMQEQIANAEDYALLDEDDNDRINVIQRNKYQDDPRYKNEFLQHSDDVGVIAMKPTKSDPESTRMYIVAIIAGVSAAALVTLITLVITWFNIQKHVKNASDVEYPAYGVTGPNKDISPSGDRRLAQSAQMYHYQHQKQQIIAMERAAANERHGSISEADSEEENEEGDYTVYECPGLAPTGEMEVKNPLFQDDPTPAQTPQQIQNSAQQNKTNQKQ